MINECDNDIAEWTPDGTKFVVKDKETFASKIIPQYYDHNNYSSFTRQLNFYGFTREQSMTIKVSDLSSLAVGQETFYHKDFRCGRPDLLKNLQRRTTGDSKSGKKRKKPRTTEDATLSALQSKMEAMEQQSAELLGTLNQLREENFASAAAIRALQNVNCAKDAKIEALEKRLNWLERKSSSSTSVNPHQNSFVPQGQRLNNNGESGAAVTREMSITKSWIRPIESTLNLLSRTTSVTSGYQGDNLNSVAPAPVVADNSSATLAPHPRMKRSYYNNGANQNTANPSKDLFSLDMNIGSSSNNNNVGAVPSRETSLDLGLLANLTRELSWMRQDTPKNMEGI